MYQRILVPVDGSDTSKHGLTEAISLAERLGATLRLFHVIDLHALYMDMSGMGAFQDCVSILQANGEEILTDAKRVANEHGVTTETRIVESPSTPVAELIVEEAQRWQAELIVMGTHGRRGVRHMVMGSDAENVVRRCTMPVLLVK